MVSSKRADATHKPLRMNKNLSDEHIGRQNFAD